MPSSLAVWVVNYNLLYAHIYGYIVWNEASKKYDTNCSAAIWNFNQTERPSGHWNMIYTDGMMMHKEMFKKSCRMIWHGAHNYFNLVEPKFSENELTQARITYRMLHHFTTEKVLEWRKYEKKRLLIRCEIIIQFVDIIKSTTAGVCFNLP